MNKQIISQICSELKNFPLKKEIKIMEVCGTHTTEFFKSGVKDFFPKKLNLIDGPGCPVCVTPNEYLDQAIEIGKNKNVILATYGDLIKIPSSYSSLKEEKAQGLDVRVIYSSLEALQIAKDNPKKEIIFLSVGFETTTPTIAVTLQLALKEKIKNFTILVGNKLTPPAVQTILNSKKIKIDGFILPGHVSAIIGKESWNFIPNDFNKPAVISGFESGDLLAGTLTLINLIKQQNPIIKNLYQRIVKNGGNSTALEIMNETFEVIESHWRGIGVISKSGLKLKKRYTIFDAEKKFNIKKYPPKINKKCRCGDLLQGLIKPPKCPLFKKECSPETPIGPCMVSTEGPCAAYFKYWRNK